MFLFAMRPFRIHFADGRSADHLAPKHASKTEVVRSERLALSRPHSTLPCRCPFQLDKRVGIVIFFSYQLAAAGAQGSRSDIFSCLGGPLGVSQPFLLIYCAVLLPGVFFFCELTLQYWRSLYCIVS